MQTVKKILIFPLAPTLWFLHFVWYVHQSVVIIYLCTCIDMWPMQPHPWHTINEASLLPVAQSTYSHCGIRGKHIHVCSLHGFIGYMLLYEPCRIAFTVHVHTHAYKRYTQHFRDFHVPVEGEMTRDTISNTVAMKSVRQALTSLHWLSLFG